MTAPALPPAPATGHAQLGRRADVRWLLPHWPDRVRLDGVCPGWQAGLQLGGHALVHDRPDTVVRPTGGTHLDRAGARQVLVEGRARPPAGWTAERWRVAVRRHEPVACARAGDSALLRHAVRLWVPATASRRRARTVIGALAATPLSPMPIVTVLSRDGTAGPGLLQLATELGAPPGCRPLVLLGGGTLLRRVAVQLWVPGDDEPSLVLKVARSRSRPDLSLHEQTVLSRVVDSGAGAEVAVPIAVGLGTWSPAGLPAVLEQALAGLPLLGALTLQPQAAREAVVTVAGWLGRLARGSRVPAAPGRWRSDGERLAAGWPEAARQLQDAAQRLDELAVPRVLVHGDLAECGNVLVGPRPGIVDWELAEPDGAPLADLLPFLLHALSAIALSGDDDVEAVAELAVRTACGKTADSSLVRRLVHDYATDAGLPAAALGPLALLAWAEHAARHVDNLARLAGAGLPSDGSPIAPVHVAAAWSSSPALGVPWPALQA